MKFQIKLSFLLIIIFINLSVVCLNAQWFKADSIFIGSLISKVQFNDNNIFVGTWNGGIYSSSDKGISWNIVNFGLGNKSIQSLTLKDSLIFASCFTKGVYSLNVNDTTWKPINKGMNDLNVFSLTSNKNSLFAGTLKGIYKSNDNGSTWFILDSGISKIFINSLLAKDNQIFAGSALKGLFLSSDNGNSWNSVKNGPSNYKYINLSAYNENILASTSGGGIFCSNNNGNNWKSINNGLPNLLITTSISFFDNYYFVGDSGSGIYISKDYGENWSPINYNLGDLFVNAIEIIGEKIYAATSSGIYFAKVSDLISSDIPEMKSLVDITLSPNPLSEKLYITSGENISNISFVIFNNLGITVYQSNGIELSMNQAIIIDTKSMDCGSYYCRFSNDYINETRKILIIK